MRLVTQVEDASDLRLNAVLMRSCSGDKKQFCKGTWHEPGLTPEHGVIQP